MARAGVELAVVGKLPDALTLMADRAFSAYDTLRWEERVKSLTEAVNSVTAFSN